MGEELSVAFGQVLKDYRTKKKWSQMKLAQEAGMHLNAIGNLEHGRRNPSLLTVFLLCRALKVPVDEFAGKIKGKRPKLS